MRTIDAKQLNSLMDKDEDWVLIDTLPEKSYRKEHIPGAHNIPAKDENFEDRVREIAKSKGDTVIVYCANKECDLSPTAAKKLVEMGYETVLDFEGGIEEWKRQGFETTAEQPAGATR